MRIYYSMPYGFSKILEIEMPPSAINESGWGHLIEQLEKALTAAGCEIVTDPSNADIELYVGQPPFRLKPEMHPAVTLSMYESTRLPTGLDLTPTRDKNGKLIVAKQTDWVASTNRFDAVINPSHWGKQSYIDSGVTVPIHVIPLGTDTERFRYVDHSLDGTWRYICQGVQLTDRKGLQIAAKPFLDRKMPSDSMLLLKTVPHRNALHIIQGQQIGPNILWVQDYLQWADMLDVWSQCHVSVNPSSGEGFGLLAAEHMLIGMCVLLSDYSGFQMMVRPEYNIPINTTEIVSPHRPGKWGQPDEEDVFRKMLWTYEHQEESIAMGKRASQWVSETFTYERMANSVIEVLDQLIKTTKRRIRPYRKSDNISDWINQDDLLGFRYK